jgi:hypothetical protein
MERTKSHECISPMTSDQVDEIGGDGFMEKGCVVQRTTAPRKTEGAV